MFNKVVQQVGHKESKFNYRRTKPV